MLLNCYLGNLGNNELTCSASFSIICEGFHGLTVIMDPLLHDYFSTVAREVIICQNFHHTFSINIWPFNTQILPFRVPNRFLRAPLSAIIAFCGRNVCRREKPAEVISNAMQRFVFASGKAWPAITTSHSRCSTHVFCVMYHFIIPLNSRARRTGNRYSRTCIWIHHDCRIYTR